MDWKSVKVGNGGKLFKIHNFNYIYGGINYSIEIDEYSDGNFTGHASHARDQNFLIESVAASTLNDCISLMLRKIESRGGSA